ncbi:MAG: amidohydrolase family protein [Gammaproteobacteria bacterium]|nr:amidohydrolase family protein [Gammaproteobacteria bacterium]
MNRFTSSLLIVSVTLLAACTTEREQYDVLIVNGTVFDGSADSAKQTNIGVVGDRIKSMSAADNAHATTTIDASGKLVVPGFIDPHTHAKTRLLDPATSANANYLRQGVTTVFIGSDGSGVSDRVTTLQTMQRQGIGTNVVFFAGHGALRRAVTGMEDRVATSDELQAMRMLLREEMEAGAIGLSSGLFYAPGSYSETSEVVELARVVAEYDGVYDTHMRSESSYGAGVVAAVEESITIGRQAKLPVHISHIKALGKSVWGHSAAMIEKIEAARDAGVDVTANQYPWQASGTRFSNALIERWVMADSKVRMAERLRDTALLPRIKSEMQDNLVLRGGPEAMLVTNAASEYVGMTLAQIAAILEMEVLDAAVEVVLNGDPSIASFVMNKDDINRLAVQPWVMTGSDGTAGHPRLYGSYPKAFGDFVRERALMSTAQFVHRSSGLVADTFRLCDRGYLRDGYVADIAIIDIDNYKALASYEQPTEHSTGVTDLLVNGKLAIHNNGLGALAGQTIRKTTCN